MTVVDATGRTICWKDVSHIDDARMADLMRDIVDRLFTFHMKRDDPSFRGHLDRWMTASDKWDNPSLDTTFLDAVVWLGTPPKA